jgi:hypothetical protein
VDAEVQWDVTEIETGSTVLTGSEPITLPADGVVDAGRIDWAIPPDARRGPYRVSTQVLVADGSFSVNATDITVA